MLDDLVDATAGDVLRLAQNLFRNFVDDAREAGETFMRESKGDFERWAKQLAKGDLTEREFQFLVKMRADEAELFALTRFGIARATLERFRQGLAGIVVSAVKGLI